MNNNKVFASDPGVLCLLPTSMKLCPSNLMACEKGNISGPLWLLAALMAPRGWHFWMETLSHLVRHELSHLVRQVWTHSILLDILWSWASLHYGSAPPLKDGGYFMASDAGYWSPCSPLRSVGPHICQGRNSGPRDHFFCSSQASILFN